MKTDLKNSLSEIYQEKREIVEHLYNSIATKITKSNDGVVPAPVYYLK
jgi:hypothetical protein